MGTQKYEINVEKTARYYVVGKLSQKTEQIVFALHGYGLLTEFFSKKFAILDNGKICSVFPEALNRFYLSGTQGRVGASWMTKEDRLVDIQDNISYLTKLKDVLCDEGAPAFQSWILLGFSQGNPTLARWLCKMRVRPKAYICWASDIPEDVLQGETIAFWKQIPIYLVCGDQDEYITDARFEAEYQKLTDLGLNVSPVRFSGEHKIDPITLKNIVELCR